MMHAMPEPDRSQRAAAARVTAFFESLTPASLEGLGALYTPAAFFKDPFNEVRGLADVRAIFTHMFAALDKPRFIITDSIVDGDQCFLAWNFEFHFRRF